MSDMLLTVADSLNELEMDAGVRDEVAKSLRKVEKEQHNKDMRFFMLSSFIKALGFALMSTGKQFMENSITKKHLKELKHPEKNIITNMAGYYPEELYNITPEQAKVLEKFLSLFPYRDIRDLTDEICSKNPAILIQINEDLPHQPLMKPLPDLDKVEYLYIVVEKASPASEALVCYFEFVPRANRQAPAKSLSEKIDNTFWFGLILMIIFIISISYCLAQFVNLDDIDVHQKAKKFMRHSVEWLSPGLPF